MKKVQCEGTGTLCVNIDERTYSVMALVLKCEGTWKRKVQCDGTGTLWVDTGTEVWRDLRKRIVCWYYKVIGLRKCDGTCEMKEVQCDGTGTLWVDTDTEVW